MPNSALQPIFNLLKIHVLKLNKKIMEIFMHYICDVNILLKMLLNVNIFYRTRALLITNGGCPFWLPLYGQGV